MCIRDSFLSAAFADRQAEAHIADKKQALDCLPPVSYTHLDVYKRQVSLLHFQSRPRGSKLHYILGRIYVRIYPLDKSATTIL